MNILWRASPADLQVKHRNIGSAYIQHWNGKYQFHAYARQGGMKLESDITEDLNDLIERADNWLAGTGGDGIYMYSDD